MLETLLPYLAGPAAAVVVLVLVLAGLYKLTVKYLIPVLEKAVTRHLDQTDAMIKQSAQDQKAWRDDMKEVGSTLRLMHASLTRVETRTEACELRTADPEAKSADLKQVG